MSRAINVKVATPKVIKSLEDKLKQVKTDKANEKVNQEKFDKLHKKWQHEVAKIAIANFSKSSEQSINKRWSGDIVVSFEFKAGAVDVPSEPERGFETIADWQYKEIVEEIENAIRILKMTDEEFVSTSTFKSIAKYL